jgi:hypothetical protein
VVSSNWIGRWPETLIVEDIRSRPSPFTGQLLPAGTPLAFASTMAYRSRLCGGSGMCWAHSDWALLGNYISREGLLAKFLTFLTALLAAITTLAMPSLNGFPVMAIVMVVINVAVLGRVFRRICVIRVYLCHRFPPPSRLTYVDHNTIAIRGRIESQKSQQSSLIRSFSFSLFVSSCVY